MKKRTIRDLFFPPRCAVCGEIVADPGRREERCLCDSCLIRYRREVAAGCAVCGRPYALCRCRPKDFLPDDLVFAIPYDKADGVCRKLILGCKNRKNADVTEELARRAVEAAELRGILAPDRLITFVPRAPDNKRRSGMDQAELLAGEIARLTGLPFRPLLIRGASGVEQKRLSAAERAENVAAAYALTPGAAETVGGRTVLLVDDVVTTGATANACAALLKKAGAASVVCLAAARTVKSYREAMRTYPETPEEPAERSQT